jgi:hypothetical protein
MNVALRTSAESRASFRTFSGFASQRTLQVRLRVDFCL